MAAICNWKCGTALCCSAPSRQRPPSDVRVSRTASLDSLGELLHGRGFHHIHRRRTIGEAAFAQAKLVHEAPNVILIVADPECALDRFRQLACRPAVRREAVGLRALLIHGADGIQLIGGEAAGTSRGAAFLHSIEACNYDGTMPAGGSGAA